MITSSIQATLPSLEDAITGKVAKSLHAQGTQSIKAISVGPISPPEPKKIGRTDLEEGIHWLPRPTTITVWYSWTHCLWSLRDIQKHILSIQEHFPHNYLHVWARVHGWSSHILFNHYQSEHGLRRYALASLRHSLKEHNHLSNWGFCGWQEPHTHWNHKPWHSAMW